MKEMKEAKKKVPEMEEEKGNGRKWGRKKMRGMEMRREIKETKEGREEKMEG